MADIEEIRRKVDRLIEERGLNYRDVSLKIGRKDSYIQQYVRYGYPRRLKEIDRLRLAKILNVDDTEIMDDEVIATKTTGQVTTRPHILSEFIEANNSPEGALVKIDVLKSTASSQNKDEYMNDIIGKHFISRSLLEEMTATDAENIKIIKITSDSMKPIINPGDSVWVDCSMNHPQSDGLYLLLIGQEPTIKRIQTSPIDGSVEISGANPNYKSYNAQSNTQVPVIGRVFYLMQQI